MLNSIELLMIETKPADIRLTQEYLKEYKIANCLNVVKDGEEALRFLQRQNEYAFVSLPDLIMINILMLLKNGVHLLKQIKIDPTLSHIPIVVLTEFEGEEDILSETSFIDLCLTKPVNLDSLFSLMKRLESGAFGSGSVRKPIPFEGDMSNEKMERARILMKVEQYDQARALLETVDHPSAHEWLAKIDDLELGDSFTAHVQPKPKSMGHLMSFIALVAGVVSIIIMFGLIMGAISGSDRFGTMLFLVLVALILLPVAYFTNKVGQRIRRGG